MQKINLKTGIMNREFETLMSELKEAQARLNEITEKCEVMSKDIVRALCKRAIRTINNKGWTIDNTANFYPSKFTFFDKLVVEMETKKMAEIDPLLEVKIDAILEEEYNKLPPIERFVLDNSIYYNDETNNVMKIIRSEFHDLCFKHLKLKKIENYFLN